MNVRPNSHVYFARCTSWNGIDLGAIKVGLSMSPLERVAAVCAQLPFECELITSCPGDLFTECFVHMWLRDHRLGGEYFKAEGETLRLIDGVLKDGKLPVAVTETRTPVAWQFADIDVKRFMDDHGLTFKEVEELSGITPTYYQKTYERTGKLNRRGLAALAVAAVKMGLSVHWPRDFTPEISQKKAA